MARARIKTRGGLKLKSAIRKAKRIKSRSVEVGFVDSARYPPVHTGLRGGRKQEPHYVATVAAWNEFGTRAGGIGGPTPERPFFRQALEKAPPVVREIVRENWDPEKPIITVQIAGLVGEQIKSEIQDSIRSLREPINAKWTVKRKGSSNPLIDTGFMLNSVSWVITS